MPHQVGHSGSYGDLSGGSRSTPYDPTSEFRSMFEGIDEKYLQFAPTYDDWKEKYIGAEYGYQGQEYGLAGELYGMAQDRATFEKAQRGDRRGGAETKLQRQLTGMGMQMGGALSQAQSSAYDIFGQGEQVATGGLGARSGLTRRAMRGVESSTQRGLMGQAMSGLEAKSQYQGTLAQLASDAFGSAQQLQQSGISYEAAGIAYDRAGTAREQQMEGLVKDYQDEMTDYLLMLATEFDVWGGTDDGGGGGGGLDPLYTDEFQEPLGEGATTGGFNNTGYTYEELLAMHGGGGDKTPVGGGGTTVRTGP